MIKRVSLVWKRTSLDDAQFKALWLGEHAELAKRLSGALEYVIDFIEGAPADLPSGIATLRFNNLEDLARAFADRALQERLLATREAFASRVEVFVVDETIVFDKELEQPT